ncbi:MAG: ferredoxin--NADP reductase [Candidatus Eisenbacteria bacterium]|uniref:Ferredoxin--NADP reductase n=1 Tax=Eiseniibacteriota bacterium TaxID=2212470 RepID=A0A538U710_UNCEI|nr:MAG: ferredoxin--NADP reductase [Candidatus Eisenbacteria bacterium]
MLPDHEYHSLAVVDVVDETADTRSFVLEIPPALEETYAYAAGQFCTFRATIGGEPVSRCYSMSSSPDAGDPFTTTVKRVSGGPMSNWMNDTLAPGDTIEVMRPLGLFVLRETDVPIVAFAGGSGITPVISIIKSALATTTRPITLVYANRMADSIIFADALERLRSASGGRLSVHHHLDSERGFLDPAACAALARDRARADFYLCGPGPYMDTVQAGLSMLGVAANQLLIEKFDVGGDAPVDEETSVTESLVIRLDRKKHALKYQPGDTILEAARRAGLRPPFSCESGSCATCMAHLDAGSVHMRVNNALSAEEVEDGWVLTCQAVPTSTEVVINYDA